MSFHHQPLAFDDAVQDRMEIRAISHDSMVAQNSLSRRSQPFDRPLRLEILVMGLELDANRAQFLKSVAQEEILTVPIGYSALSVLLAQLFP